MKKKKKRLPLVHCSFHIVSNLVPKHEPNFLKPNKRHLTGPYKSVRLYYHEGTKLSQNYLISDFFISVDNVFDFTISRFPQFVSLNMNCDKNLISSKHLQWKNALFPFK